VEVELIQFIIRRHATKKPSARPAGKRARDRCCLQR